MNKKRLSVVMAGAMLASSVAPVLAVEVVKSEHSANDLGLLIGKIREKLNSQTFAAETADDKVRNGAQAGMSIYEVKVGNTVLDLDVDSEQADYQRELGELKAGQVVEIWTKGFVKEGEKYYATSTRKATYAVGEIHTNFQTMYNDLNNANLSDVVEKIDTISAPGKYVGFKVYFKNGIKPLEIKEGSTKLQLDKYVDGNNDIKLVSAGRIAPEDFKGFAETEDIEKYDLDGEKVEEITITPGGYDLALSDLYDGLFLTEKGQEFFTTIKEAQAMRGSRNVFLKGNRANRTLTESNIANEIVMKSGKGYFKVVFEKPVGTGSATPNLSKEVYTITGTNEKELERIALWMLKPQARVDILAGANRYETAAEIAREYCGMRGVKNPATATNKIEDLVLVNGDALVDGLAAAPLAATLEKTGKKVPMLLTEADTLPKATRTYLKELMADHLVGANKSATIHLVGGEAVLSTKLARELRNLGFEVERYGGENREATSLEVAEAIEEKLGGKDARFVVGAEGEADAMSIASVAASKTTPIIVAKKGGISEDGLYELKGKKATIVGGKNVVSEADYKAIKAEASAIERVYGSNRQKTNAKVIAKYYKNGYVGPAKNVMVANKDTLVDALVAANMASSKKAPIVLASNKLDSEQINALELNAKGAHGVYQIGANVARPVVKTIAENLGLSNR